MRTRHCRARLNVRSLLPTPAYAPTQWLTSLLLEEIKNLCQHGYRPLLPCHLASAASAWGSQKAMSMAR
jgi:hypothetical protein